MALAGELAKYIGNEMVKTGGKELAKAGAKSALSSLVPSLATKVGTDIATKAGVSTLNNLVPKMATSIASPDTITLYRGLTQKYDPKYPVAKLDTSGYESWTDNKDLARKYGDNVYSIEVPKSDIKTSYLDEDPMSPTYGDRNPIYKIDKKAGLDGVSGKEYLLEVGSDYQKGLTYNEVPSEIEMVMKNSGVDSDVAKRAADYLATARNIPVQQSIDDNSITLYHGTPNKFEDFDESLPSVWFSDSDKNLKDTGLSIKGGQSMNIMERQLPKDLKIADEDLADRLTKQQLQDRGYAGIAYTERGPNGDETYYEIFSPNKNLRKMPKAQQSKVELNPQQQEFFKDSVIRDKSGILKKMYHGSPNGEIKEFNPGSYFTENKEYADGYQNPEASSLTPGARKIKNTPKTYEVYLNIKKPFTLSDAKAKDIYFNEYIKGGNSAYYDPYGTTRKMIDELDEVDWVEGVNLMEWLQENHPEYDGMYLDEGGAGGYSPDNEYVDRGKSIVNFRSDQVKILN